MTLREYASLFCWIVLPIAAVIGLAVILITGVVVWPDSLSLCGLFVIGAGLITIGMTREP